MKYVVLARDKKDGNIIDSFGVFRDKKNANWRLTEMMENDGKEYLVEEVDPNGNYANDECEDE